MESHVAGGLGGLAVTEGRNGSTSSPRSLRLRSSMLPPFHASVSARVALRGVHGSECHRLNGYVIATGARATGLPIPGLEEAGYLTNENVFALTERPRRLLVIGAGPIGCELAQAFRRFGAEVTVAELMDRVLFREDKDASAIVARALTQDGVELCLGARTFRAEVDEGGRGRGAELDLGARAATGSVLWFVHADALPTCDRGSRGGRTATRRSSCGARPTSRRAGTRRGCSSRMWRSPTGSCASARCGSCRRRSKCRGVASWRAHCARRTG